MQPQRVHRSPIAITLVAAAVLLLLSACAGAAGPNNVAHMATGHTSGFWAGLWHGIILPIAFIVSLFSDHVGVYDVHNNGGWYNFGFVLGAGVLLGGGGRRARVSRRKSRSRDA